MCLVAAHGQTRIEAQKRENLPSCLLRGPENCLDENTKRGERYTLPLQGVVHQEISQVPQNDRFAALTNCFAVRRGEASPNDKSIMPYLHSECHKQLRICAGRKAKRRPCGRRFANTEIGMSLCLVRRWRAFRHRGRRLLWLIVNPLRRK